MRVRDDKKPMFCIKKIEHKYDDGTTEEVNGFDVEVPALDEEFDLALIGTKGKWYDHKVKVSNPEAVNE